MCVCANGYTGKYCETGNVLAFCNENSSRFGSSPIRFEIIHVAQLNHEMFKKKKAELVYHVYSQLQPFIKPIKIVCVSQRLNEDLKMQKS